MRNHFIQNPHLAPKNQLHIWTRDNGHDPPVYLTTALQDRGFRAVVTVVGKNFSSLSKEKVFDISLVHPFFNNICIIYSLFQNKRFAENAAASVALHFLGVQQLVEDQVNAETVAIS